MRQTVPELHTHVFVHTAAVKTANITGPFFGTRQREGEGWRGEKTRRGVNSGGGLKE